MADPLPRKIVRDAPVETTGVQKTHKILAASKDGLPAYRSSNSRLIVQ